MACLKAVLFVICKPFEPSQAADIHNLSSDLDTQSQGGRFDGIDHDNDDDDDIVGYFTCCVRVICEQKNHQKR